jgi:hypothetical protein
MTITAGWLAVGVASYLRCANKTRIVKIALRRGWWGGGFDFDLIISCCNPLSTVLWLRLWLIFIFGTGGSGGAVAPPVPQLLLPAPRFASRFQAWVEFQWKRSCSVIGGTMNDDDDDFIIRWLKFDIINLLIEKTLRAYTGNVDFCCISHTVE